MPSTTTPNVAISKGTLAIAGVLIAAVFFATGYFTSKTFSKTSAPNGMQFAAGGNGQRQGAGQTARNMARNPMGGFVNGELVKKDATSFSIKQRDGSLKLVLITSSTKAMKMSEGSLSDFATGQQVMVTGSSNSDGSITAQTVQIRPEGALGGPGMGGPGAAAPPVDGQPQGGR